MTSTDLPTHFPGSFRFDRNRPRDTSIALNAPAVNSVRLGRSYLAVPVMAAAAQRGPATRTPGVSAPRDRTPPRVAIRGRRRQDIDRLAIRVRLSEAGSATVTGRVKVAGRRRTFRLRRVRKTLRAHLGRRFRLKPTRRSKRRVRRALRHGRRARARIKIVAVDRSGNRRVRHRTIRLRP